MATNTLSVHADAHELYEHGAVVASSRLRLLDLSGGRRRECGRSLMRATASRSPVAQRTAQGSAHALSGAVVSRTTHRSSITCDDAVRRVRARRRIFLHEPGARGTTACSSKVVALLLGDGRCSLQSSENEWSYDLRRRTVLESQHDDATAVRVVVGSLRTDIPHRGAGKPYLSRISTSRSSSTMIFES